MRAAASPASCPRPVDGVPFGFGAGNWSGAEVGLDWDALRTRACWVKRAHRERRVAVWFDSVPDKLANASCARPPNARWRRSAESVAAACERAKETLGDPAAGFSRVARVARRRRVSVLLVGDSVDRKMWEALNNSRAAAELFGAGVCVVWTPQLHSPELALSWQTFPEEVERLGAPHAARELRASWERGEFFSFAKLDKAHDELASHTAVLRAAGRPHGVPAAWLARAAPSLAAPAQSWRILHGRPDVCRRVGPPTAVVLHAAYHTLWSYLRFANKFTPLRNVTTPTRQRHVSYRHLSALPSSVIDRYTANFQSYARQVKKAFPEASLVAIRTAQLLDYVPFSTSRKYMHDWQASPLVNVFIRQLNSALRKAAEAENLALFDVERMLEQLVANPRSYVEEDNLHLNPAVGIEVMKAMLTSVAAATQCTPSCRQEQRLR